MKEIALTKGKVALVDDTDFEWLSQWKWYAQNTESGFYACRHERSEGKRIAVYMHRRILQPPDGVETEHSDRNTLNNQRSNLRCSDHSQNMANKKLSKRNPVGFKGVWKHRRKYVAWAGKDYLGIFDDPVKAALAYDNRARTKWGEFALTNQKLGLLNPQ